MLPPRSFVPGYLFRGLLLWLAVHLGAAFAKIPFPFPLLVVPGALAVIFLAARVDDRARRDDPFLGNLGIPPSAGALVSCVAALTAELVVQVGWHLS